MLYNLPKSQRSLCAQIRCGILPLHIETGRYRGLTEEDRLCEYCELGEVEDEIHFILFCPLYHDLREKLFRKVTTPETNLMDFEYGALIEFLFDHVFPFSEYLSAAWDRRRRATYK